MEEKNKITRHSFQPGAMSIIQMGEELIGHPSTAINELVKNGYDADALSSKVYFHYSDIPEEAFAVIFDNGNGMDSSTLFGDWLKPSVSSKRSVNTKSEKFKRNFLGSKGIGRLASMALGESVNVITRKKETDDYNWITVNREAFREEKLLSEIDFPGDRISNFISLFSDKRILEVRNQFELQKKLKGCQPKEEESKTEEILDSIDRRNKNGIVQFLQSVELESFSNGTLIIIESLDDSILKILRDEFLQIESSEIPSEPYKNTEFYKSLATLITPLTLNTQIQEELFKKGIIKEKKAVASKTDNFSIEFATNLIPEQTGIEWLPIDPIPVQSVFDYRVYGKVTDEGEVIGLMAFNRLENDPYERKFKINKRDLETDEDSQLELFENKSSKTGEYYFDIRIYDIGEKDNLEKLAGKIGLTSGAQFRKVFKNFQGLRISKNGFGVKPYGEEMEDWIELSKARVQNPGQNVNTNQILGYVFFYSPENDELEEKTNREGFLENSAFRQVKSTLKTIFSDLGKKRYNYRLLHGLGRIPTSKHDRPDFEEYLRMLNEYNADSRLLSYSEKFMKEVTTAMDNIEESLSFSERLASLGSGIELVYHEMAQPISRLRTTKSSLDLKKDKINEGVRDIFISDVNSLHQATDTLVELRGSLQPAIGRTRKKNFIPYDTFLKVCNLYKSDMEEHNISITADERLKDYAVNDLEYAFWITFLNIINNAVYWLKKSERPGEIRLFMEQNAFVVSNSGPFINEELIDHIFNYGVTTRSEKNATGLGLAFTQSILSRNDWKINAENRSDGPAFIIKKSKYE